MLDKSFKSELLSPCGSFDHFLMALQGGGDAFYLGGKNFSARMSSPNFTLEEIKKTVIIAHLFKKKVYVTLNVIIFQDEFLDAYNYCKELYKIGIDGLIIQDLGLAYYLHQRIKDLPLHASTQLSCKSVSEAESLLKLGFKRVVLARETPLETVRGIKKLGLEVEVFIHGALCVSYSGQCYFSSFLGPRSGNRGKCAQVCRKEFSLLDQNKKEIDKKYFISPKDLNTLEYLEQLVKEGVDCLKIEGRLKSKEYVYFVTKTYRKYLDDLSLKVSNDDENLLTLTFSRDFTKGYLFNESKFSLLNQESSSNKGLRIGKVIQTKNDSLFIKLENDINLHDGIKIKNNHAETGFILTEFYLDNNLVKSAFKNQIIKIKRIKDAYKYKDSIVYKTTSSKLSKIMDEETKNHFKAPIKGTLSLIDDKLILEVKQFDIKLNLPFEEAKNNETDKIRIYEQLKKSKDLFYYLDIDVNLSNKVFIKISDLNNIRNQCLEMIERKLNQERELIEEDYIVSKVNKANQDASYKVLSLNPLYSKFEFKTYLEGKNLHLRIVDDKERYCKGDIVNSLKADGFFIASQYFNVVNSYALDALYYLNYDEVILSLELDKRSIKSLVDDYYSRHQSYPKIGYLIYGKVELMVMKSCILGTYFKIKKDHCNICKNQQYYLKEGKDEFIIRGDTSCYSHILNSHSLNLLRAIDDFKDNHFTSLYLQVYDQEDYKVVAAFLKENEIIENKITYGHYYSRPE